LFDGTTTKLINNSINPMDEKLLPIIGDQASPATCDLVLFYATNNVRQNFLAPGGRPNDEPNSQNKSKEAS
jgi:hypothetical protein